MTTTTTARPRFRRSRALDRLAKHLCACIGCEGATVPSEYPSWRRCQDCGCCWTISMRAGLQQEGLYIDARCPHQGRRRAEGER